MRSRTRSLSVAVSAPDEATATSELAVLDATDVAAGPVASVPLPQRVPYGFHATWMPA